LCLADLSQVQTKLKFDPKDYDETQTDPEVAQRHIEELLNFQSQKDFNEQKNKLKGEQQEDWIKF
jgi:hypothetical protein